MTDRLDQSRPWLSVRVRLWLLAAVHLVGLIGYVAYPFFDYPALLNDIVVGCAISQPGLVGIGLSLPKPSKQFTLPLAAIGLPLFTGLTAYFLSAFGVDSLYIPLGIGLAWVIGLSLKLTGYQIRHVPLGEHYPLQPQLSFGIRHLLIATAFVAVGVKCVSWYEEHFADQSMDRTDFDGLLIIAAMVCCFTAVSYLGLWATLHPGRISLRLLIVPFAIYLLGVLEQIISYTDWNPIRWYPNKLIISVACFTIATFLVVRWCGYRLVRRLGPRMLSQ